MAARPTTSDERHLAPAPVGPRGAAVAGSLRGLVGKLLLLVVFAAVPIIVYGQFREADREKAQLVLRATQEQSRLIAHAIQPLLVSGAGTLPMMMDRLKELAGPNVNVKVLFRPAGASDASAFFYVAGNPPVANEHLAELRHRLLQQGVLDQLDDTCDQDVPLAHRYRAPHGREELMTSIRPVQTAQGCWAVVTSLSGTEILDTSIGKAYWQATEVQLTIAIYFGMAALVIAILIQIWRSLHRFSRLAGEIRRNGGNATSFRDQNTLPELDSVAAAFDGMVDTLRKLSDAIEHSPSAIVLTDRNGTIEYVNPAFTEISGYSHDEVVGRSSNILRSGETPPETYDELWRTIEMGRVWRGEIQNRRKDGRLYWAHLSIWSSRKPSGEITHFIGIHEDVTEQKIADLALEEAKSQAEVANRAKSDFLANVSHELRTQLNAILGFSEIVGSEMLGNCNVPQYIEYARDIHVSGQHLLEVINDILDLSKLEAGKMELHEQVLDLGELVQAALRLVHERAAHHGVALDVEARPTLMVRGDQRILKQALLNLLSNAIKFTPRGGHVTVRTGLDAAGAITMEVADTGIGIAPEDLGRVMEPYGQAHSDVVRRHTGTGLGLPLVKKLVELHGGTMAIASRVGEGTTVSLRMPADRVVATDPDLAAVAAA
ncbi:MAG: PAS domain S-box protein [Alphaproteobacteria bacterium]|nr:PAS domain S-box protein [Alphaproteobacteria bacterium]